MENPKNIIDMRTRPTALDPFYGESDSPREKRLAWINARVGSKDPLHFKSATTVPEFIAEARKAGIARSLVIGRQGGEAFITNDRVAEIVAQDASLVGIGAVDPTGHETGGVQGAVEEVHRSIKELKLHAIEIDPGFCKTPMLPNDRRAYPVYSACDSLGIPVFIMGGPLIGPTMDHSDPRYFANVANDFPDLKIIVVHGAYPYVQESIALAYKFPNVYISPGMYMFMPGGEAWVTALNGFLSEQFVFGTGYPYRPMVQTVNEYLALPLSPETFEATLSGNASRVLNLS